MTTVTERLYPGDPLEHHGLRVWPEDDLPRAVAVVGGIAGGAAAR